MLVRAIRAHYIGGQVMPVGAVYDIGDTMARELFTAGRVEMVTAPPPPADPAPPPPKRRRASEPVPDPLPLKIDDEVIDP